MGISPEFRKKQNLLYEYALILLKEQVRFSKHTLGHTDEERRDNALYLIKFIFKYVYQVPTYEEAIKRDDIKNRQEIKQIMSSRYIYLLGMPKDGKEMKIFISTIDIILYFIYNDYDLHSDLIKCYKFIIEGYDDYSTGRSNNNMKGRLKKELENMEKFAGV